VAEDNPINREVATAMLDEIGFEWDVAGTGREALEALSRRAYDAVLMDGQMPELDGYEATAELRRREGTGRRTPVIAMTAHALAGDRERCLAAGMDDYLSKPVYLDELRARLDRWIGEAPAPAAVPEATAAASDAPPPADLERLRRVCRRPADQKRMLDLFFTQADETMAGLATAVPAESGDSVRRLAHALAGASANLGFGPLSVALRVVERAGREGQWGGKNERLDAVRRELAALRRFLDEAFPAGEVSGGPPDGG
jgi:CheY-like chemotaxis protein/HPt (histidine-containing phosphotransfer) domain-containing protein